MGDQLLPMEKDPLAPSAHGETPLTQLQLLSVLDKTRSTDLMTRRTVLETSSTPSCKKSTSILNSATKPPLLTLLPVPPTRMLLLRTRPTSSTPLLLTRPCTFLARPKVCQLRTESARTTPGTPSHSPSDASSPASTETAPSSPTRESQPRLRTTSPTPTRTSTSRTCGPTATWATKSTSTTKSPWAPPAARPPNQRLGHRDHDSELPVLATISPLFTTADPQSVPRFFRLETREKTTPPTPR